MTDGEFNSAGIYRILKKAGAERVGDDAVLELRMALEDIGLRIAQNAVELSMHAGRRTVKGSDVKLAVKNFLQR